MAEVYNWQLGRKMSYPYDEAHPDKQFAFVFNINRCIACQTCTMSCKSTWTFSKGQEYMWWNNVETKPYGGYPKFWDVKLLSMLEQANPGGQVWNNGIFNGQTIFEAAEKYYGPDGHKRALGFSPDEEAWRGPNHGEDAAVTFEDSYRKASAARPMSEEGSALPEHRTWFFYLQRLCNHCTYPACLAACPRKAIYKREEDGIVLIDQERCRGYRKCVEACPYKKPMYRGTTRVTEKCVACYPRIEGKDPVSEGRPMETRCMTACVGQIRLQGLVSIDQTSGLWKEDRQNPLYYLVHVAKVALPLYPQFGTEPNGFYIPPRWVPRPYLRQMFGPGVDQAIETYVAPNRELLAVLQLFRKHQAIIFRYELDCRFRGNDGEGRHLRTLEPPSFPAGSRARRTRHPDCVRAGPVRNGPGRPARIVPAHVFQKSNTLADIAGFYRAFGLERADGAERLFLSEHTGRFAPGLFKRMRDSEGFYAVVAESALEAISWLMTERSIPTRRTPSS